MYDNEIYEKTSLSIKIVALLHDVDDGKYFDNKGYKNTRAVLRDTTHTDKLSQDDIELIIKIISRVSASVFPELSKITQVSTIAL